MRNIVEEEKYSTPDGAQDLRTPFEEALPLLERHIHC